MRLWAIPMVDRQRPSPCRPMATTPSPPSWRRTPSASPRRPGTSSTTATIPPTCRRRTSP
ncbi:MAG: hypothetical protein COZ06_26390 [Armatimonadetes bacterium CG_4_10_14_3_um_filter_66_18]|nr:MAG: hypothetical protein COS65_06325 [Armatimonadetes bacterium CG06_land_8_20_14_3_00_66_21]PIX38802.1 MAG: hypothetical protein COZ57_29670 [Armatimonadetes bacterium CG_4_8_14_3_um_filter_66_20]PIY41633.1 MAG: hypothetical protein COZ06_26390 [Armatimonadetes bacterium CG_4_10_14_3_um_filter_66_18]PIZ39055.1 MAG: hypothetical protein COY42_22750 [Armatimonadetes bacterium CG_4_10_14_0_8_um_filter_66_14]PJB73623.1 MAG: hypothetical protein CO096_05540 [Armatimonadetes bacterium CG_4_9_14_